MLASRWGRIVNVSSSAGVYGRAGFTHYSTAKAGMIGFTKSLSKEVADRGVTVNAIAPGVIDTDIHWKTGASDESVRDYLQTLTESTPMGRMGTAGECAAACLYLVSPEAAYVTGQVIQVDGGLVF